MIPETISPGDSKLTTTQRLSIVAETYKVVRRKFQSKLKSFLQASLFKEQQQEDNFISSSKNIFEIKRPIISFDQPEQSLFLQLEKSYHTPQHSFKQTSTKFPKLAPSKTTLILPKMMQTGMSITCSMIESPLQQQAQQLEKQKQLMQKISTRIADQLSLNNEALLQEQKFQRVNTMRSEKLTKSKPISLVRKRNSSDYSFEEEEEQPLQQTQKKNIFLPRQSTLNLYGKSDKCFVVWCDVPDETFWKPQVREGAQLCNIKNRIYFFGGLGQDSQIQLHSLDIGVYRWQTQQLVGDKLLPRHGHSMSVSKAIFIIGGEVCSGKNQPRFFSSDIVKIDVETKTCKLIQTNGLILEGRRNHTVSEVGGINQKQTCLSDCLILNTSSLRLDELQLDDDNPFINGITFHASASVFQRDKFKINLYHKPTPSDDISYPQDPSITHEGIYVYGGTNNNQEPYDKLYKLDVQVYPARWSIISTKGRQPPPLIMHTMNLNEQMQQVIIYGGKVEQEYTQLNNEIFVLTLQRCIWIKVQTDGVETKDRFGHCTVSIGSKIIVFGGLCFDGYVSPQLTILELNKEITSKKVTQKSIVEQKLIAMPKGRQKLSIAQVLEITQQHRQQLIKKLTFSNVMLESRVSLRLNPFSKKSVSFQHQIIQSKQLI